MSHQTLRVRCNFAQGDYIDAIVSGAQWAAVVGLGAYVLGSFIGLEEGQTLLCLV